MLISGLTPFKALTKTHQQASDRYISRGSRCVRVLKQPSLRFRYVPERTRDPSLLGARPNANLYEIGGTTRTPLLTFRKPARGTMPCSDILLNRRSWGCLYCGHFAFCRNNGRNKLPLKQVFKRYCDGFLNHVSHVRVMPGALLIYRLNARILAPRAGFSVCDVRSPWPLHAPLCSV